VRVYPSFRPLRLCNRTPPNGLYWPLRVPARRPVVDCAKRTRLLRFRHGDCNKARQRGVGGVGFQVKCASRRCERRRCSARDARIVPQTLRRSSRKSHEPCADPHGWGDRWGGLARGKQAWEDPTRPIRSTPCRIGAGFVGQSAQLSWTTAQLTWNPTPVSHARQRRITGPATERRRPGRRPSVPQPIRWTRARAGTNRGIMPPRATTTGASTRLSRAARVSSVRPKTAVHAVSSSAYHQQSCP